VGVVKGLKKGQASSSLKKQKSGKRQFVKSSYKLNKVAVSYEPTNIDSAYNSDYWRWKRVKAWYKEFKEDYSVR